MQRSTGLVQIDEAFLTHYHLDHVLGLVGLIKTYELLGRERALRVNGPPGLGELFRDLRRIIGRVSYELRLVELAEGDAVRRGDYEVRCFPVEHKGVRAFGYALVEDVRPGRLDPEAAARLGVEPGPDLGALQRGEEVQGAKGTVRPEQVVGEVRPGRKVVITGDTRPCEMARIAAHEADLLVHDASFADEESERAAETGHSTAREAARVAREAQARALALVHVSSRYHVGAVLDEAREEFPEAVAPRDFDLIEIPFAERGAPRLVQNGARERPEITPPESSSDQGSQED